jgi:hypothetical protein
MLETSIEAAEVRTFKIFSWLHMKINNDTYMKLSLLIQENLAEWVRTEVKK